MAFLEKCFETEVSKWLDMIRTVPLPPCECRATRPGKSEKAKTNERKIKSMKYSSLRIFTTVLSVLACLAFSPPIKAAPQVAPAPDGCYPAFTTAEGCQALQNLSTGSANTGVGWRALFSAGASSFNTGVGAGALVLNTGDSNTAVGTVALLLNTDGSQNTAVGVAALENNSTGASNTANGAFALSNNTDGSGNTAVGLNALISNTSADFNTAVGGAALSNTQDGSGNTAMGVFALTANIHGTSNTALGLAALQSNLNSNNTAVGAGALGLNTIAPNNTAVGHFALHNNVIGGANTAVGADALSNALAASNIALGNQAGSAVVNASNVIAIGSPGDDIAGSCFIGNIRGVTTDLADAIPVVIDSVGQLGTMSSSARFKKDIKPMETTSNSILDLQPVTFHYKSDKSNTPQFGLIAEEVAKVNPDLVVHDKDGQIYTVRYDAINAMLLGEFIKEHKKVQALEATVAQQQKGMEALTAQVQKVSAQIEVNKPAPKLTANNE